MEVEYGDQKENLNLYILLGKVDISERKWLEKIYIDQLQINQFIN